MLTNIVLYVIFETEESIGEDNDAVRITEKLEKLEFIFHEQ